MRKTYPAYKDSGIEWMGQIPDHWEIKKIKYTYTLISGNGFNESLQGKEYGDYPFCKVSDINHSGTFVKSAKNFVSEEDVNNNNYNIIPIGSIIFAKIGEALKKNHRKINLVECIIDNNLEALAPNQKDISKFSYYLFSCIDMFWFDNNGTIPCINNQKLLNFCISNISIKEQKQIVSFLDHKTELIDKLIKKTKKKINLLKEYRTSLINYCVTKGLDLNVEMKDSGVKWIGEIPRHWFLRKGSTIGIYSKGKGASKSDVKGKGIPCIRYGEIYTTYDRVVYNTESFLSENNSDRSIKVPSGTVLMTGSGETAEDIGKCVVYLGKSNIYVGSDIIIIDLVDDIEPLFMSYLMNSESVRFQKSRLAKGEIIVHIYSKNIREILFCIPPIPEQKQIVDYLDSQTQRIDTLIEKENNRIELLKEYRQSLISDVVTGKIDVREEVKV